ncbi:MAG TPA: choice-of-anchor Q domain-containing protein [Roseiflexaceae bacterium]|nr:choice-of-anchor Q domain-containing protein [Roseiflexaceae bacterium]
MPLAVVDIDGASNYAHVQPGDVLCLAAGPRENVKIVNLHGRAGSPITIRNEGGTVSISGMRLRNGGISVSGSSYLRITGTGVSERCGAQYSPEEQECGIEIGFANKGIRFDTDPDLVHHIEVDHVYIHDLTTDTNARGILIHPGEQQLISGVYVHHNYLVNTKGEAIYIGSEPRGRPLEVLGKLEDVEVSHNRIERIGYDGIKIKVAVKNVKVHHNAVYHTGLSQTPAHDAGIQMAFSVGEYYNNYVETALEGIAMGRTLDSPGTRYYNNVVVGADRCLVAPEYGAQIFHNTVVGCGTAGISATGDAAQVFDNIVVGTRGTPVDAEGAQVFANLIGPVTLAQFVDPAARDFHLRFTSPAIDAGRTDRLVVAVDFDDRPRPYGVRPDMGAYEYREGAAAFVNDVYLPSTWR